MKQERILIKEGYNSQLGINFHYAMERLRESLTNDKLKEVGLSLTTEVLGDILSGASETETKVRNTLNEQLLSGCQLPAVRRNNEVLLEKLLSDFLKMIAVSKSAISEFRFIPAECFHVDGTNRIEISQEGERILKEASNLYIDKPEQIEVYRAAQEVLNASEKLQSLASKYKCNAFNHRAVLALVGGHLEIIPDGVADCHPDGIWMRAK